MWMLNPEGHCRQHLLGAHNETHCLFGSLRIKKSISGHVADNQLEVKSLKLYHDLLADEMRNRQYNHRSPLEVPIDIFDYLEDEIKNYKIDRQKSLDELFSRCEECKNRFLKLKTPMFIL